jgi:hypothetical protein
MKKNEDGKVIELQVGDRFILVENDLHVDNETEQVVVAVTRRKLGNDDSLLIIIEYDGAINADPGSCRVMEPVDDEGRWWLDGSVYRMDLNYGNVPAMVDVEMDGVDDEDG